VAEAQSAGGSRAKVATGGSKAKVATGGSRPRAKKAAGGSRVGEVILVPGTGPEAGPKVAGMLVVEVAGMVPGIGPEAGPKVEGMVVEVAGMVVVEVMILGSRIIFNVPINNGHVRKGAGRNEKLPRLSENSYVSPTVYKYT